MDARRKPEESVGRAEESPLSTEVPIKQREIKDYPGSGTDPPVRVSLLERWAMLTPDESARAGAPILVVGTTEQINQK